jgi:hypothetical protein
MTELWEPLVPVTLSLERFRICPASVEVWGLAPFGSAGPRFWVPGRLKSRLLGERRLGDGRCGIFTKDAVCGGSSRTRRLLEPLIGVSRPPVDKGDVRGREKLGVDEEGGMMINQTMVLVH